MFAYMAGLEVWTAAQYAIALQRLEWPSSVDVMFVLQPWEILRSDQENVPHVPVSWNTRPLLLYESLHVISTDHMYVFHMPSNFMENGRTAAFDGP